MEPIGKDKISQLGAGELAFIGDSVFELLVRSELVSSVPGSAGKLHKLSVARVNAVSQAAAAAKLIPHFSTEEAAVFNRGRNMKHPTVPQGATHAQYSAATALETLFGWLYLSGMDDRIKELYGLCK